MPTRLLEQGPAVMVPAAWVLAAGAVASVVAARTVLVALIVMDVLLVVFLLGSRGEMDGPVLSVWRTVLVVGLVVTLAGTVGLVRGVDALVALSLYAWAFLPAGAYVQSYRVAPALPRLYLWAGVVSAVGGVVAVGSPAFAGDPTAGTLAGLALVGLGQTAGIVHAVVAY